MSSVLAATAAADAATNAVAYDLTKLAAPAAGHMTAMRFIKLAKKLPIVTTMSN